MGSIKSAWNCMFSPRLVRIYGHGPVEKFYEPQPLEKWGDQVIHSLYIIWKLGLYTSPFIVGTLYQRGYFEPQGLAVLSKFVTGIGVILVISFCVRGFSRAQNPVYMQFIDVLQQAQQNVVSVKHELNKYDFEFTAWPVEYSVIEKGVTRKYIDIQKSTPHQDLFQYYTTLPFRVIAYFAIHTFGIRLMYPGSITLLQTVLGQSLLQGRSRLIESYRGERFKLKAVDGNSIDAMFIDKRNTRPNGNVLVICCEGNAGFYEIGTMITPLEVGYSVLGWNHPGFGGSTGMPYPPQEQNAVDVVIQFAINKLGFRVENIMMFGWSIGGYPASWAAMNYPEIRGVVIDATFDDVLPLALNQMPRWWEPIVKLAVKEHINLDIFSQLSQYPGPILLIRRTEDEVICLRENDLSSNRGNNLLIKLLRHRYPCVYEESQLQLLEDYLRLTGTPQDQMLRSYNAASAISSLQSYISDNPKTYPMRIGEDLGGREKTQLALFLASKYMEDFKATHCVNLPGEMFHAPWDISVESDFVFT